ncbi:nuclear transport factor 2 family protein [Lyngbya sp. CCY1209]|uniref:nuclear transport factor 2 family protein n=1 Tax=Lyngbya sp. CCY1209 TaxID=2886103 RepID=UPI002D1FD9F2|nr:ketosteroid isomerase family protein [Lyngbya sp. CCY1209]MEB3883854.1 ketosteroid isomerase family protein [Lyngbya sp. CCY1209]
MTSQTLSNSTETILEFADLEEETVRRYFETMNGERFRDTAALFCEDGVLEAPLEETAVGPEAIATYLQAEAKGMTLQPKDVRIEPLEGDRLLVQVLGRVKTSLFSVNVGWQFVLNADRKIAVTTVRLLASPQEMLNLRPFTKYHQNRD